MHSLSSRSAHVKQSKCDSLVSGCFSDRIVDPEEGNCVEKFAVFEILTGSRKLLHTERISLNMNQL